MPLESIIALLARVLALDPASFTRSSPLLGSVPELDSMAVVQLLTAIEETYGFAIEDDEISGAVFATVNTLNDFVQSKLAA
jgi:acyl carrier protein